jgi:Arc/MetJ-type ribon-helix-helix transcriptional regulator
MTQISVRIPDEDTEAIDRLVEAGHYTTRSAFVGHAVREILRAERERAAAESYRRAYAEHPFDESSDESWVIDAGRRNLRAQ